MNRIHPIISQNPGFSISRQGRDQGTTHFSYKHADSRLHFKRSPSIPMLYEFWLGVNPSPPLFYAYAYFIAPVFQKSNEFLQLTAHYQVAPGPSLA